MSTSLRLIEQLKPIWAGEPKSYSGAAFTAKYVSMKLYDRLVIWISTGAWAAGTAAVTLLQATTVTGTSAKALAFLWVWINTAALPDTWVKTAVTSNTFNLDTANLGYWIEVVASDLDVDGGFDCVTLAVASPGANADFYGVNYLAAQPRYPDKDLPSALVN